MNRKTFFDAIRKQPFRQSLSPEQVAGIEAKLDAFEEARWPLEWAAYGLATSYHETGAVMQPVREGFKKTDAAARAYVKRHYWTMRNGKPGYGRPAGPYSLVYYGRGDVQLTWLFNYERAGKALSIDLVKYPDLALEPAVSARIMIRGMQEGWFTGQRNSFYLKPGLPDYIGARRIINGTDKAALIAGYADQFERALRAAGYDGKPDATPAKPYPESVNRPNFDKTLVAQAPVSATKPDPAPNDWGIPDDGLPGALPPSGSTLSPQRPQPRKGLFSWLGTIFKGSR